MIDRWISPVWKAADGTVKELTRVSIGQSPFSESELRDLLATHPAILPTRHFDPIFARPVCLGTEFPVPGVGRIDALFLSPTGYLTIVETKLWRNPEARREVVAQIIDYARALAQWTYAELERGFRSRAFVTPSQGTSLSSHVCKIDDDTFDEPTFVDAVNRCLRHGRFLLLLVGDGIRDGVSEMTEFLQQTPMLQYTLGLVELACYRGPSRGEEFLFVPHVVARTASVTRAIVQIDLKNHGDTRVGLSVEVPPSKSQEVSQRANRLSEEEFYDLLRNSASPNVAQHLREFLDTLLAQHDALEAEFTPRKLLLKVQTDQANGDRLVVLAFTPEGRVWTNKAWLDFLADHFGAEQLSSFIDGLGAIDPRMRPRRKLDGALEVPKTSNAADLTSIVPKLPALAALVSNAVNQVAAGPVS